jgi:hypothetical protein
MGRVCCVALRASRDVALANDRESKELKLGQFKQAPHVCPYEPISFQALSPVSPDALGTACPPSGRNSTDRPVQILEAGSRHSPQCGHKMVGERISNRLSQYHRLTLEQHIGGHTGPLTFGYIFTTILRSQFCDQFFCNCS